jgi:hypothetical protein
MASRLRADLSVATGARSNEDDPIQAADPEIKEAPIKPSYIESDDPIENESNGTDVEEEPGRGFDGGLNVVNYKKSDIPRANSIDAIYYTSNALVHLKSVEPLFDESKPFAKNLRNFSKKLSTMAIKDIEAMHKKFVGRAWFMVNFLEALFNAVETWDDFPVDPTSILVEVKGSDLVFKKTKSEDQIPHALIVAQEVLDVLHVTQVMFCGAPIIYNWRYMTPTMKSMILEEVSKTFTTFKSWYALTSKHTSIIFGPMSFQLTIGIVKCLSASDIYDYVQDPDPEQRLRSFHRCFGAMLVEGPVIDQITHGMKNLKIKKLTRKVDMLERDNAIKEKQIEHMQAEAKPPLIKIKHLKDGSIEILTLPPHSEEAFREADYYCQQLMAKNPSAKIMMPTKAAGGSRTPSVAGSDVASDDTFGSRSAPVAGPASWFCGGNMFSKRK